MKSIINAFTEKVLLSRIKTLEIQRDEFASERDKVLLNEKTVLTIYTEWLIDNNYILTGNQNIDYVAKFKKAVNTVKKKL